MNMFWNGRWADVTGQRGHAAFVHMLRAAMIAAVASSCANMKAQSGPDAPDAAIFPANAEEPPHAPPVRQLDTALSDEIKDHAYEVYNDLSGVQRDGLQSVYITISYTDVEDGQEKLLSLATSLPEDDPEVKLEEDDEQLFRIPIDPKSYTRAYKHAMVIFTGSPDKQTPCGNSGGSNYCNF